MKDELFIHLGQIDNIHFFIRVVQHDFTLSALEDQCVQIFNAMIHETMIQKNQKVIVFNICKDNEWFLCLVDHISFPHLQQTSRKAFKTALMRLLTAHRDPLENVLLIRFNGLKYLLYEFPVAIPHPTDTSEPIVMKPLSKIYTNKPITYL